MGQCQEKLGQAEARKSYERVVKEYAGAGQYAAQARARLAAMSGPVDSVPAAFAAVRIMGDMAYPTGPVSLDGRWLPWLDPEHGDLGLRDMKTGEIRKLTNERSGWVNGVGFSVVSPDSTRVAFAWSSPSNTTIQMVNLDGTGRKTLVPALGSGVSLGPLAWMPDGKSIVAGVSVQGSQMKFGIVSVASGQVDWHEPVALVLNQNAGRTSLSPDGRYLLVPGAAPTAPENQNIFVYDLSRKQLSLLVDHPAIDMSPAWSTDGKTVYFVSDRRGLNDIYALSFKQGAVAGDPLLLHSVAGRLILFGVSANGSLIALERSGSTELYSLPLVRGSGAGKPARIQTRVAGGDSYPVWSPDGKSLAFLRTRGKVPALIVLRDAATKAEREIAPGFPAMNITWHPDGRRILMTGAAEDGMATLDTTSGQLSKIAIPPGEMPPLARIGYSVYSPTGTEIYYGARIGSEYRKSEYSLVALNTSSGQSRKVNGPSKTIMYRVNCFSPDGKWFLFYEGTVDDANYKSLMIRPAAGGEARELTGGQNIWLGQAAFTPDSKDVIVGGTFTHLGDVKPGFWRISVDGGSPRKIHQLEKPVSFSLHPSGREIVYSGTTAVHSLWAFPTESSTSR